MPTEHRDPLIQRCARAIRRLREARGVSQETFARQIGVNRTHIGILERGKTNPTLLTLARVAEGLGLTFGELALEIDRTRVPMARAAR